MARTKDTTEFHLRKRRSIFQKAMDELENSSIHFKRKNVIATMHSEGYPDYTIDKYYSDLAYISRNNTFVRSLTEEGVYSRHVQDTYSQIQEYKEQISDWIKDPPKTYRQIVESKPGEESRVTRSIVTTVSPVVIANLGLKIIQLQSSLLKGDVIDTSFATVQDEMESLRKQLAENKTCL